MHLVKIIGASPQLSVLTDPGKDCFDHAQGGRRGIEAEVAESVVQRWQAEPQV